MCFSLGFVPTTRRLTMSTAPVLATNGEYKDLLSAILQAVPSDLSAEVVKKWLRKKKKLGDKIRQALLEEDSVRPNTPVVVQAQGMLWQEAEAKAYVMMGMAAEYNVFAKQTAAPEIAGRWVLHMVKGLSYDKLIDAIKEAGSGFWSYYDNLQKSITVNDRDCNRDGSYGRSFLATQEADPENANKSANDLARSNQKGITVMERLLLGLIYFLMTGEHLDVINWTICCGSRDADGNVPLVYFLPDYGKVELNWFSPDYRGVFLRSRSAVSLPVELRESAAQQATV